MLRSLFDAGISRWCRTGRFDGYLRVARLAFWWIRYPVGELLRLSFLRDALAHIACRSPSRAASPVTLAEAWVSPVGGRCGQMRKILAFAGMTERGRSASSALARSDDILGLLFSREGGSPDWVPAFAGKHSVFEPIPALNPPPRRRPGPNWGTVEAAGSASLLRLSQLGPGLRRGGFCQGGALRITRPRTHQASAASTPISFGKNPSCAVRSVSSAMTSSRSGRSKIRRLPPVRPKGSASTSAACAAPRKSSNE